MYKGRKQPLHMEEMKKAPSAGIVDNKNKAQLGLNSQTLPRPRIPRDPNRHSPLKYAYQDTPYRKPQYRRDFFPQGPQGRPPGLREGNEPHRLQGGGGTPPETHTKDPHDIRYGKTHGNKGGLGIQERE